MKRILIVLSAFICVLLPVLASCTPEKGNTGANGNSNKPGDVIMIGDGLIFDNSVELAIVINEENVPYSVAETVWNAVKSAKIPRIIYDTDSMCTHEIVIGPTERQISKDAYKRLENMENKSEYPGFIIYSNGSSVAIAYDDNELARDMAIEHFVSEYLTGSSLEIEEGVDFYTDILTVQEAIDEAELERYWAAVEEQLGADITRQLKAHYNIYTDNLISWYANLYEPYVCVCDGECQNTVNCGGGGFYYSNSARNTPGYLPDIESTNQALNTIVSSGMSNGEPYSAIIPDWMQQQIVQFVKMRQDPNGYFYHPQWSKEDVDQHVSRRSRDLDWAGSILYNFGAMPTYSTPDGGDGDGLLWDGTPVSNGNLTGRLSHTSSAVAVSAVVKKFVSTSYPEFLENVSTFNAYLNGLDIDNQSYHVGNELTALVDEINARDKVIGGGEHPLADALVNYLNAHQNPNTGLWSDTINYYSVNGLFKITGCYTNTGHPIPNSDKALVAAIDAITSEEEPGAVVDIYNTWYTINNIVENIELYQQNDPEMVEKAEKALAELRANAVRAIKATTDKLSVFRKDDGSFSYNPETTSHTSQGMAVAVPGTNEGDVNATVISTTGTTARMMKALGIDFDKKDFDMSYVPIYTKSDWIRYSAILEDLGPVIKDEEAKPKFITFEDEFLGENPVSVSYDQSASAGLSIIVDPTEGSTRGQILEIDSITGRYNSVNVLSENKAFNKACYVFEGEICIPSSTDGYVVRLRMTDLYAFALKVSGGKVHIWDVSTASSDNLVETDLGIAIPLGEWFKIKVEYYRGDHDSVRMKLYINDEIAAVNDNYYDQYGKKVTNADGKGVPGSSYTYFGFSTMSGHNTKIYLDNLCCYSSNELYQPYTDIEKPLKINVDLPDRGELIYPFDDMADGANFPDDFTVTGNGASVKPATGTDKVLNILNSSTPANISVEVNKRAYRANVYIAEMTLKLNSADVGSTVRLALGEGADSKSSAVIFDITVTEVGGKKYLSVADAHNDNTGVAFPRIKIEQGSEAKLTVEYYKEKEITLIYLDGNLMAASTQQSSAASRVEYKTLNIAYISSGAIDINIDDLKAECVEKDYSGAGISIGEDKVYDFNTAENTIPGTTVIAKDGDRFTELSASSGSILIPVNDRSLLSSMTVFKAGIAFADDTSGEWTLIFENENGGAVFALVLKASGGKLWLYEKTETGKSAEPIGELDASAEIFLSVEWFREYGVANIHVNDKYVTATTANYSGETSSDFISYIELSAEGGTGTLRLDDVVSENRNEADEETDDSGEIPEENAEVITFENTSDVKKIPSKITHKLASAGSQFKLERTIRDGILSKVISLTSYPGGNDEINIDLTKKEKDANVAVFEADMYIDYADNAASKIIEFYLRTKGGGANAYKFEIWQSQVLADGKLEVLAFPGEATWFKFKIEYYEGGKIIAYVNGVPVAAGDNFVGTSAILPSSIERLRIYTRGDFEGSIKLDNISFIQTTKTYVEPEIEGGGSSLGANKDVLDFEDGLVNESMQIGQGSGNGSTLKVLDDGTGNNILVYTTGASAVVDNQLNLSFTKSESGYNAIVFETDISLICSRSGDHNYFRLKSTAATGNKRACFVAVTDKNIIVYYNGGSKTVGQLSESKMTKLRIEYGNNGSGVFLKIFVDGVCVYAEDNYVDPDSNKIKMADVDHMEISTWRTNVISKFDNVKLWKTTVDTSVKPDVVEIPGTTVGTASMDGNKYTFENGNLPSSFGYQGDDGVFRTLDTIDHGKVLAFDSKTYGKSGTYNLKLTPATVSNATKAVFQTDFFLADNTDANLSNSAAFEFKFTDGSQRIVKLAMGKSGELRVYYGNNSSAVVTTFATGTWYNIKIEYYEVGEGYGLKVFIDGLEKYTSEAYDFTSNAASDKSVANVKKFDILTYGKITAYFDNIVCTQE